MGYCTELRGIQEVKTVIDGEGSMDRQPCLLAASGTHPAGRPWTRLVMRTTTVKDPPSVLAIRANTILASSEARVPHLATTGLSACASPPGG